MRWCYKFSPALAVRIEWLDWQMMYLVKLSGFIVSRSSIPPRILRIWRRISKCIPIAYVQAPTADKPS